MPLQAPTNTTKGPIRCLVIQLARMGDTLQSLMALRAAKELYPQLEIHFVARDRFAEAVRRVPWIKQVITLPTEKIVGPVFSGDKEEAYALQELAQWLIPMVEKPWDMIVNWSFSESSSYLTSLLPGRIKLGYTRRKDSTFSAADGWSYYVQGIIQEGIPQDIHLTDILTTQFLTALQIHIGDPAPNGDNPVTSKYFFSLSVKQTDLDKLPKDTNRRWLGVQLGTSKKESGWDAKSWAKFLNLMIQNHAEHGVFLMGSTHEIALAEAVLKELPEEVTSSGRLINLVGQTDFDLWASVMSSCQWLFSGNSAAIQLGAVLGVRVIQVSQGQDRFYETGAYGNGHYILGPDPSQPAAGTNAVTPEALYAVWIYANNEWRHNRKLAMEDHFHILGFSGMDQGLQVYRSLIRQTQDGGGVRYEAQILRPLQPKDWASHVVGHIARAWYCGWVPEIGKELNRKTITPELIKKLREYQDSAEVLSRIYEKAYRTAASLKAKSSNLKSGKLMDIQEREQLQDLATTLVQLDELTERVAKMHPPLACFYQMAKVLMHNLSGEQLFDMSSEAAKSYRQLNEGVALFKEWIKFTLKLAKPVAIQPAIPLQPPRLPQLPL